jgi:DNA-directed RNA polymerase specialized sigma24 family protein
MGSQSVRQSETAVVPESTEDLTESPQGGVLSGWRFRLAVMLHDRAIYRVAAALLRDAREAEDVTQEVFVSYEQHEIPEPSDGRDPAWHYEQNELSGALRKLVDTLPEPQRSLLVMFDVQGHDGETCARVLGLNTNQVKVYLHRARRRLREQLERAS